MGGTLRHGEACEGSVRALQLVSAIFIASEFSCFRLADFRPDLRATKGRGGEAVNGLFNECCDHGLVRVSSIEGRVCIHVLIDAGNEMDLVSRGKTV